MNEAEIFEVDNIYRKMMREGLITHAEYEAQAIRLVELVEKMRAERSKLISEQL